MSTQPTTRAKRVKAQPHPSIFSMSPDVYEVSGDSFVVDYGSVETEYGSGLMGAISNRIVFLGLTTNQDEELEKLTSRWNKSRLLHRPEQCQKLFDNAVGKTQPARNAEILLMGTDFQIKVWKHLIKLSAGETSSYQAVAEALQQPTASRAVANAVASNPVALLVPCHRVIRSDGSIGGYAWGEELKREILQKEGIQLPKAAEKTNSDDQNASL